MKSFIAVLVCAVLATALAAPNVDQEKVKESVRKVKEAHEVCNNDPATQVDQESVRNLRHGGEQPANLGPHALCVSKKLGWQNEDGSVNEELIRSRATAIFGENSNLEAIINECVKPQGSPEATAAHLFVCYRKNQPRPNGTRPSH